VEAGLSPHGFDWWTVVYVALLDGCSGIVPLMGIEGRLPRSVHIYSILCILGAIVHVVYLHKAW
jgi:hypothetical protein